MMLIMMTMISDVDEDETDTVDDVKSEVINEGQFGLWSWRN